MIKKRYRDQPIWFKIIIPSALFLVLFLLPGQIIISRLTAVESAEFLQINNLAKIGLFVQITGIILSISAAGALCIYYTRPLTKLIRTKFQLINPLQPATGNEKILVEKILEEYSQVFNRKNAEIADSEQKRTTLIRVCDEIPLPLIRIDPDGKLSYMNKAAKKSDIQTIFDRHSRLISPWKQDLPLLCAPGGEVIWEINSRIYEVQALQKSEKREIALYVTDISDKISYQAINYAWEQVFSLSGDGMCIMDSTGIIYRINESFTRQTGYREEEIRGRNIQILRSARQNSQFYDDIVAKLENEGKWAGELWYEKKDGELFPQQMSISCLSENKQADEKYFAIFHNISELKHKDKQLDRINYYDHLTNLPNRNLFMELLSRALKSSERSDDNCACILIDIDDLEGINETRGFGEGDQLLQDFSRRLEKTIRDGDTAARLSGDEFVLLLPRLSPGTLSFDFLKRIQKDLTKPFRLGDEEISIGISMGISVYPKDGNDPDEILKKANTALSRTKESRRGAYTLFDPEYDDITLKNRKMEQRLSRAVAKKEFELYYQPKIQTGSEAITGFEALLRWNNETPISPSEFIPLAEKTGMIVDIGKFVIDEASRFLKRLSTKGREDLKVAINVSARQFKDPGFESYLVDTVESNKLSFSRLELEVTEGITATETPQALTGLASLSEKGFPIAIDDFGTGYSSMNYLQDLRFDTLKIDKSFIDNMTVNQSGRSIVKAIIALGKSINKEIVAEGVETRNQLDILECEGCDTIQGYYYSRPVPEEDAIKLIDTWPGRMKKNL